MSKPLYIVLEGVDSCGKSTHSAALAQELGARLTREPGSTKIGGDLRSVLLDPANRDMTVLTELLLMNADRAQNIAQVVIPALESETTIVSDRSFVSTLAYQAIVRGLDFDLALEVCKIAMGPIVPDIVILLDIDIEQVRARRGLGEHDATDRFEQEKDEFRERLILAYREIALRLTDIRFATIDARGSQDEVYSSILETVRNLQREKKDDQ